MRRSYKFRLYPNISQTRELEAMLETHRRLYNECLHYRIMAWELYQVNVIKNDQVKALQGKRANGHPYYSRLSAQATNETIKKLDDTYNAFFRRIRSGEKPGFPRFKGKEQYNTFGTGSYLNNTKLIGNRIRVKYIGNIKVNIHREIQGKIKTVSFTREAGKWFAVFSCDLGEVKITPSDNPPVGIDVGLTSFLTTDEGEKVENPRYLKKELPELRRRQRSLSRKKKGGTNRHKARKKVTKLHARIKNLRRDHHYKVALNMVRRYGLVAVESLNIKGMLRNRRLARSIGDVAWGNFLIRLKHKAEEAGVLVVEVDPRYTSQACSRCKRVRPKDEQEREEKANYKIYNCTECKLTLDRDVNAARNILIRAIKQVRVGPAGHNGGKSPRAPRNRTIRRVRERIGKSDLSQSTKT